MGDRTPGSRMSFTKIVRSRRHTVSPAPVRPSAEPRPAPIPPEPLRALVRRYQDDVPDPAAPFRPDDLPQLRHHVPTKT